jgi:hypothetical protein
MTPSESARFLNARRDRTVAWPWLITRCVPTTVPFACDHLAVVLVRPTRYDDDGYVVRHWLGTLPSNTLSCLNGLTHDAVASGALGSLVVRVHAFDEAVDRIDPKRLGRRLRRRGTRVLVALAGVQTNQFPRAQDLARQFKAEGFDVMIGSTSVDPWQWRTPSRRSVRP